MAKFSTHLDESWLYVKLNTQKFPCLEFVNDDFITQFPKRTANLRNINDNEIVVKDIYVYMRR